MRDLFDLEPGTVKDLVLHDYQSAAINAARENIRQGHQRQILCSPTGSGKCLGRGTPILMADGTMRPVESVAVGDRLASPTGGFRTVLSLGRGREQLFRVVPTKGDAYVVNASHLLSLRMTPGSDALRLADGRTVESDSDFVVVEAGTLFRSNATARHVLKGWRSAVDDFVGASDELPIAPYVLGAWLGDGTLRRPSLSKPAGPVVSAWTEWGASLGECKMVEGASCPTWTLTDGRTGGKNAAMEALRAADVLDNKHIPHLYKIASPAARLELIAGLLDTDGSVSGCGYDWITCREQMAHDMAFVCRSVGLAAYVTPCVKGIRSTGFSGQYWRISISGDCDRIPCRAKKAPSRQQKKRHLVHGLTLEPMGEGDYFGFEIDGDRLFMLGDFTVTHNTIMGLALMQGAMRAGSRSVFVSDRVSLVDQTSTALDLYGLDHGVMQATHWRQRPGSLVQLVSAQTLGRRLGRGGYVDSLLRDLRFVVVDEAHTLYSSTLDWLATLPEHVAVVGLTATPFTRGLGRHYSAVVNVASTDALIERGVLARPVTYVATTEMDTSGVAVRSTGEWDETGLERAGVQIVGDVVSEYFKRTGEHFGGPVKTIVFSSSVRHGEEICRAFAQVGLNFANISYHDSEDERRAKIAEFRKHDSMIVGLVSVDALSKGFDAPDVRTCILCRPLRKSFTVHCQQLGRVLRSAPGKDMALVIDHTGNCLRFLNDTVDFWAKGVNALDEGAERDRVARPPVSENERKELLCLACNAILPPGVPSCLACGRDRPRRPSNVTTISGTTHRLHMGANTGRKFDFNNHAILRNREVAYRTFLAYAVRGKKGDGDAARRWAAAMFKGVYGAFPPWSYNDNIDHDPTYLTLDAERLCRNEMARYSKKRPTNAAAA